MLQTILYHTKLKNIEFIAYHFFLLLIAYKNRHLTFNMMLNCTKFKCNIRRIDTFLNLDTCKMKATFFIQYMY